MAPHADRDEETTLLPAEDDVGVPDSAALTRRTRVFTLLPAVLLFLSELAELLLVAPRIRLLEASICRLHYAEHDPSLLNQDGSVDEALCKITPVQTRLAYIRGWQVFWEAIPVLALAMPWGWIADKLGRKKVLSVNFAGCLLHILGFLLICHPTSTVLPERIWFTAAAFALGGGPRTGGILILALVNDISPAKKRSERFYYTYSAFLITELIAPHLSSLLMGHSLLSPFYVSVFSLLLAQVLLPMIPTPDRKREEAPLLATEATATVQRRTKTLPIVLLLILHFLCPLRQELVFQIMIPYASHLFSLPIRHSGLMLSVIAFSNLLAITLLLPRLPRGRDLLAVKLSLALLTAGCVFLGGAATLWQFIVAAIIFAGGFGVRLAVLGMLTACVPSDMVGRTYTLVTVVEGIGEMVWAGGLQSVWSAGLEGRWGVGWVWGVGALGYAGGYLIAIILGKVNRG